MVMRCFFVPRLRNISHEAECFLISWSLGILALDDN